MAIPREPILKTVEKQKHNLACHPDFKLLVVLSVPRSAFLASFQPAGASKSLPGLKIKNSIKNIKHICVYRAWGFHRVFLVVIWLFLGFFEKVVSKALY
jgi:hypothetical protein